jgi:CAAX protease family protein
MIGAGVRPHGTLIGFAVLVLCAYCVPPLLIYVGIIPFAYRFHVLVAVAAALALVALRKNIPLRELGLRTDNLKPALLANALLSLVLGGATLWVFSQGLIREPTAPNLWWFAPFYVLVSCPAQEFSCRGFLFAEMNRRGITGAAAQIAISSVAYAFLHIIYNDWLTVLAPLFIGVIWGVIYRLYPNLWGVIFSHAVLGLISIIVGLV